MILGLAQGHGVVSVGILVGGGVPRSVFVLDGVGGTHHRSPPNRSRIGQRGRHGVDFAVATTQVDTETQPVGGVDIHIQTGAVAGVVGTNHDTFVVEVAHGGVVTYLVGTARCGNRIVLNKADACHFIPPVGIVAFAEIDTILITNQGTIKD